MEADIYFMQAALKWARRAAVAGEIPVGALWVGEGGEEKIGACNRKETRRDPTAHAEMEVLRRASRKMGRWRLQGTLYVTLEPCLMCAGALISARIARLVYGAPDPKAGACGSLWNVVEDTRLCHRVEVTEGVMADASSQLLRQFFKQLREREPEHQRHSVKSVVA